jgi:bifunctional non-homologous end joining protein LigD
MLARSGPIPTRGDWSYEVKWDGFRAIVSTERAPLCVRSRRGWDMTPLLRELSALPIAGTLDGELVAFGEDGRPDFPLLCERMLMRRPGIPVTLMIFDLLSIQDEDLMRTPYSERRAQLEALNLNGPYWRTPEAFDDGSRTLRSCLRTPARGRRGEASRQCLSAGRARLDQDQESRLLALRDRARVSDQRAA